MGEKQTQKIVMESKADALNNSATVLGQRSNNSSLSLSFLCERLAFLQMNTSATNHRELSQVNFLEQIMLLGS